MPQYISLVLGLGVRFRLLANMLHFFECIELVTPEFVVLKCYGLQVAENVATRSIFEKISFIELWDKVIRKRFLKNQRCPHPAAHNAETYIWIFIMDSSKLSLIKIHV